MKSHSLPASFVRTLPIFALVAASLPARGTWTLSTDNVPDACTHVITDGNWQIGVYKYSDERWSLGKAIGWNGSPYLAGSGDLDLRSITSDCGVVLTESNNGALEKLSALTSVHFPDSLVSTAGNTFKECTSLTNVVFGSNFKTIGGEMFRGCTALKAVTFPPGLETIERYGFNGCSALELSNFTFPSSLTTIGDHCFTGCKMISGSLTLPGLTTISGTYQFEDCVRLTDFYAPLLTTIPQGMFNRCTGLASATFSPDLASIGQSAFENGGAMTSFSPTALPKLTSFGQRAFRGQSKLAADFDLSLSTITTLPYYAFVDCAKVGRVTLPESLTTLGGGCLAYNKTGRVVWFLGAPPTTVDESALDFRARGCLVAGIKHANEWKSDSRVAALEDSDKALSDYPGDAEVKESLGLQHTRPIGKWSTQTGSYWHWVVEALPTGTVMLFR